uniref:Uncharacterized protein n=1 Tax=Kalanchoe fedtschenkoi TaxID=63787 RepID=A0A7N0TDT4_KALFE
MAKLAATLTLFIALFVFTHAKLPLDLPNDGSATIRDPSITLPEPESKRTIMLPSEKPESEPATVVELDLNERETAVVDTGPEVEEMMEEEEENIPIAFTDMRLPVWERGDGGDERRMFMFRHPHHRCHHPHRLHHHRFYHQFDSQRPGPEVSYGNDMLVAEPEAEKMVGEDSTEAALPLHEISTEVRLGHSGGVRRAPSRWVRFHFGEKPRFHDHGPHHHHHDEEEEHHHHDDEEDGEHRRHDEGGMLRTRPFRHGRREEGGGLVKRIRKFLHQFE